MEIFSYQRSFPTAFFRLNGKIRLIVIVISGNVSEIVESFERWFTFMVAEILNGLFGKRCVILILDLWYSGSHLQNLASQDRAVQVITVITAGRKVHTRRESPVRICLRVLRVCPVQLEVLRQAIIGKSLVAQTGNQIGALKLPENLYRFR